jgi:hypothetical protein
VIAYSIPGTEFKNFFLTTKEGLFKLTATKRYIKLRIDGSFLESDSIDTPLFLWSDGKSIRVDEVENG